LLMLPHAHEGGIQIGSAAHAEHLRLDAKRSSGDHSLLIVSVEYLGKDLRRNIRLEEGDPRERHDERFEEFQTFRDELMVGELRARNFPAGPCKALDEPGCHEVTLGPTDYDGDGLCFHLKVFRQAGASDEEGINSEADEIPGTCAKLFRGFTE